MKSKINSIQKFKGKPPPTQYLPNGLPLLNVVPTAIDKQWNFCDLPIKTDVEYFDIIQGCTLNERFPECIYQTPPNISKTKYDSREIGIQCFDNNRWPEKTDLLCWWCLHKFDSRPFPCPVYQDKSNGTIRIRGVFCGPSCAKAWAKRDGNFPNTDYVCTLIDMLAKKRGFCGANQIFLHIPPAPPRSALYLFCGPEGLTIDEFRGLCAAEFDVTVLYPPLITEKQVVVAECERMIREKQQGRVMHLDSAPKMMTSAMDCTAQQKRGFEIFAGVGAKRLSDYINTSSLTSSINTHHPVGGIGHRGKIKRPLSPKPPADLPEIKKRKHTVINKI